MAFYATLGVMSKKLQGDKLLLIQLVQLYLVTATFVLLLGNRLAPFLGPVASNCFGGGQRRYRMALTPFGDHLG
jgi:hypothetical protein